MPLSSMDTIQVLLPVDTTSFHSVDTSILFFLYLKNMDTLDIDLNNITH